MRVGSRILAAMTAGMTFTGVIEVRAEEPPPAPETPVTAPAAPAPALTPAERKSVDAWIDDLDHREPARREAATEALRSFGARGLPSLRAVLEDASEESKARARLLIQTLEAFESGEPNGANDWFTLKGDMGRTGARGAAPTRTVTIKKARRVAIPNYEGEPLDAPLAVDGDMLIVVRGDLVTALGAADLAFQWEMGIGDRITASPVVAGGLIYLGTTRGLTAIRLADRKEVWTIAATYGVGAAPLVAGNTIYACVGLEAVVALDAATGAQRWQHRCDAGNAAPVLAAGRVILGTRNGEVLALDAATGKKAWTVTVDGMMAFAPAAVGGSVLVGDGGRRLRCIDGASGRVLWTRSVEGRFRGDGSALSTMAAVFSTTNLEVEAYDPSTGRRLWRRWMGTQHLSSPVLAGRVVLVGSRDRLEAMNLESGDDLWSVHLNGEVSCPLISGGRAYALAGNEVVLLE
jgi:outer membrane protein assembly factor BamB